MKANNHVGAFKNHFQIMEKQYFTKIITINIFNVKMSFHLQHLTQFLLFIDSFLKQKINLLNINSC